MASSCKITIDGKVIRAKQGEKLLDAALRGGAQVPYDCRAGHCGTCIVKLNDGQVQGGQSSQPGCVHACQSRLVGDVSIEVQDMPSMRTVRGVVGSVRNLSAEVVQLEVRTEKAFPYLAGQYAQLKFNGYPQRPFSLTHPLRGQSDGRSIWFHIRRMKGGKVTPELGRRLRPGSKLSVIGPYGSAYFRPNENSRMILVATGTGFAPIWSIIAAALHENPNRKIMLIVGGSNLDALYMGPALGRLKQFPNVRILPVCSAPQTPFKSIRKGRPTDFVPRLYPSDVVYTCGVPAMVEDIKQICDRAGAVCYADPFVTNNHDEEETKVSKAFAWLPLPNAMAARRKLERLALPSPEARVRPRYSPARAAM
ncbi:MAG: 2Fe-2S iron-sulfur cluster binding domain-containing protein [Hyphomicrobiales bacterium]|nr:2Fe-2S iron-sulfur cluster binding domain-containing protein [Hyphomicrobiales bacterium]